MRTMQWIALLAHLICVLPMFHKRARQGQDEHDPTKRFRANLGDLFLANEVSGARTQSLFSDAQLAGAQHLSDLAGISSSGTNCSRDLVKKFMKRKKWPALYKASLRVWDPKTQTEQRVLLSMLLPHELVSVVAKVNSTASLLARDGMAQECQNHLVRAQAQLNKAELLGVGLWCDAVPYNWDRSQSMEIVSISLPGLSGSNAALRLPVFGSNKKFLMTDKTYEDVFEVLSWSFRCLAVGVHPSQRHDGSAWTQSDAKRRRAAATSIGISGVLCEVRGDWSMLKQVFRFPAWNEKRGCCWLCRATPATIRQCGQDAVWRNQRLTHFEFLARQVQDGLTISSLFGCPCLTTSCFKPDWLHAVDQGTAADFLGSLMHVLLPFFPGANKHDRCKNMFLHIRAYYRTHAVDSKYDNLTVKMFHSKKGFKLRGKAAEVRGLITWARLACDEFLSGSTDVRMQTIRSACHSLAACYAQLSHLVFDLHTMAEQCRRYCMLCIALDDTSTNKLWRTKPKLHLMQELCELQGDNPSKYWTYRDEDFGGTLAGYARHRGGGNTARSSGTKMLIRFLAKHSVPRL